MAKASLERRIEILERQVSTRPRRSSQFDEDAFMIIGGSHYLDATMDPTYNDIEPTAIYARGKELWDKFIGPIIPANVDEHIKRYTRASGEFELTFGREPKAGDVLHYEQVALMHRPEIYSRYFGRLVEAWNRQLPQLTCPLKFENDCLFRRLNPARRGEESKWEEDLGIQVDKRWFSIPQVLANVDFGQDFEILRTAPLAVVFLGVVGTKHQCRPATTEEVQNAETEPPGGDPMWLRYGRQRFCELLVEVMGA